MAIEKRGELISLEAAQGRRNLERSGINLGRMSWNELRKRVANLGVVGFEIPEHVAEGHIVDGLALVLKKTAPAIPLKEIVLYGPDLGILRCLGTRGSELWWENDVSTGHMPIRIITDWKGKITSQGAGAWLD